MTRVDAAIESIDDDVLGRRPYVEEIVALLTTTPVEWRVRVGIYGSWGAGKTSVLNMVAQRVAAEGHIVVRFNPWGINDVRAMFAALADAVVTAAKAAGIDVKSGSGAAKKLTESLSKSADKVSAAFAAVSKTLASAVALSGVALAGLSRLFEKELNQVMAVLVASKPSQRYIVLVDDLDRADPVLLPPLLFALHDTLAALPMAFVLALDPVVVGAALAQHHPGFGDGLQFLEKIVQFPRWLPEPSEAARVAIAKRELAHYMPGLDADTVRQEFALLPSNPRELQTMLRGLWGLQAQLPRYAEGEINWRLLLRITALRYRFRKEMDALLQDEARLDQIAFASASADGGSPTWERIGVLSSNGRSLAVPIESVSLEIRDALDSPDLSWNGKNVIEHALLVERPVALTKHEFDLLFEGYSSAWPHSERDTTLQQALHEAADAHLSTPEFLAKLTIQHALAMHHDLMQSAMKSISEDALSVAAVECYDVLKLLSALLLDDGRIQGDVTLFNRVLKTFLQRARLTTSPAYLPLRKLEREILLRLCATADDPGALLEILQPWDRDEADVANDNGLLTTLDTALTVRIEPKFLDYFDQHNAMQTMVSGKQRSAERWCLLRYTVFSKPEHVKGITQLTSNAARANCYRLLQACIDQGTGTTWYGLSELPELAKDVAITDALWATATRVPINVRFFSSYQKIRSDIERKRNAQLANPAWWAEVSAAHARLREP